MQPPAPQAPQALPTEVVALIHGIRTEAVWTDKVKTALDDTGVLLAKPIKYGYLDVFRFLLPGPSRHEPIQRVVRQLRALRQKYPHSKLSVVAHSFGTYIITRILSEEADISLCRLVLCGSIVPQDYRWELVASRVEHEVLNDCGSRDLWPLLASSCSWGYGPSGTFGFGAANATDRFHDFCHSDFFDMDFVRQFWLPFFRDGVLLPSLLDRPTPPWWKSALARLPFKWLLLVVCILVTSFMFSHALPHPSGQKQKYILAGPPNSFGGPGRFRIDDFLDVSINGHRLARLSNCYPYGNCTIPIEGTDFEASPGDELTIEAFDTGGDYYLDGIWLYKDGKVVRQLAPGVGYDRIGSDGKPHRCSIAEWPCPTKAREPESFFKASFPIP